MTASIPALPRSTGKLSRSLYQFQSRLWFLGHERKYWRVWKESHQKAVIGEEAGFESLEESKTSLS